MKKEGKKNVKKKNGKTFEHCIPVTTCTYDDEWD